MAVVTYKSGQLTAVTSAINTDMLTLSGTASTNYLITIMDGNFVVGTTTADSAGNWNFSSTVTADRVHLFDAIASDGLGDHAAAVGLYSPARYSGDTNTTTFSFGPSGIDISFDIHQSSQGSAYPLRTVTNHYDPSGQILSQKIVTTARSVVNNTIEVITAPDQNGVTTYSKQSPDGKLFGISDNIVKNYYDSTYNITHQDTFTAGGVLLSVLTAADAHGNSTLTNYSSDGSFTQTGYANASKVYTNHYDRNAAILSQDRFDTSGHLISSTTAPDSNGDISSTVYDVSGHIVAHVEYSSADTLLDLLHITDGNSASAVYQLYTGDGIHTIGVQLGEIERRQSRIQPRIHRAVTHHDNTL